MSSTIRVYKTKDAVTTPVDDTSNATQWTDADDGAFSVSGLDTTGWDPGTYDIHVTRQGDGYSESAPSNTVPLIVGSGLSQVSYWSGNGTDPSSSVVVTGVGGTGLFLLLVGQWHYDAGNGRAIQSIVGSTLGNDPFTIRDSHTTYLTDTFGVWAYTYNGTIPSNETITVNFNGAVAGITHATIVQLTGANTTSFNSVTGADGVSGWPNEPYILAANWPTGWTANSLVYGIAVQFDDVDMTWVLGNGSPLAETTALAGNDANTTNKIRTFRLTAAATANGQVNFGYNWGSGQGATPIGALGLGIEIKKA